MEEEEECEGEEGVARKVRKEGEQGVAPLLKSRDHHLSGDKTCSDWLKNPAIRIIFLDSR